MRQAAAATLLLYGFPLRRGNIQRRGNSFFFALALWYPSPAALCSHISTIREQIEMWNQNTFFSI